MERTKEDVILSQVKPIFKAAHFEELLLKAQDARNNLQGAQRQVQGDSRWSNTWAGLTFI